MQKTKTTSKVQEWNLNLRNKVGDSVIHLGRTYINISGRNSEPPNLGDWEPLTTDLSIKMDKSTDPNPSPFKFQNELEQWIIPPQITRKTVYVSSVNGNDSIGELENIVTPFLTIQAALNTIRSTDYTDVPSTEAVTNQKEFWNVVILDGGTYDFEFLTVANVKFVSDTNVIIRAVSQGRHFTTRALGNTDPDYENTYGSLELDMPNGEFHIISLDNTFTIRPYFDLNDFIVTNCKKIKCDLRTSISSNQQTPFHVFAAIIVRQNVDLNFVDVESNRNFIYIPNFGNNILLNFGNINIIEVDDAVAGTSAFNPIFFSQVRFGISNLQFSYISFNCTADSNQTFSIYFNFLFLTESQVKAPIQIGDFNNLGQDWRMIYSLNNNITTTINYNNSFIQNAKLVDGVNFKLTGRILNTSNVQVAETQRSAIIRSLILDGLEARFNWDDVSPTITMFFYQLGLNTMGQSETTRLIFRNTTLEHNGTLLLLSSFFTTSTPTQNADKYAPTDFQGVNKFIGKDAGSRHIIAYLENLGNFTKILKTGKLFTTNPLDPSVSEIQQLGVDDNFYIEIT